MTLKKAVVKRPKTRPSSEIKKRKTKHEAQTKKTPVSKKDYTDKEENAFLQEAFYQDKPEYETMMSLIDTYKKSEIAPGTPVHRHHIVPRAFFGKCSIPVNDGDNNLVTVPPSVHLALHYYAWKCARPKIKNSMGYAFRMMIYLFSRTSIEVDAQTLLNLGKEYEKACYEAKSLKSVKVFTLEDFQGKLTRYESPFVAIKLNSSKLVLKCKTCGYIKEVNRSHHKKEIMSCPECAKDKRMAWRKDTCLFFVISKKNKKAYWIQTDRVIKDNPLEVAKRFGITDACAYKVSFVGYNKCTDSLPQNRAFVPHKNFKIKYSEEDCRFFAKLYNSDFKTSKVLNVFFTNWMYCCKSYGIKLKDRPLDSYQNKRTHYYIEEFDEEHTIPEWEAITGLTFQSINKYYTVEDWGDGTDYLSMAKFFYPIWKKYGESFFDSLRRIFELMDKYSNDHLVGDP